MGMTSPPPSPLSFLFLLFFLLVPYLFSSAISISNSTSTFTSADSPWLPTRSNFSLLSPNSTFSAGFLPSSPSSSLSLFVFSVWFTLDPSSTPVWSLSPQTPVNSSSALTLSPSGRLSLLSPSGQNLFAAAAAAAHALVLHDDGHLSFGAGDSWSSFSSPSFTLLPNQSAPLSNPTLRSRNGLYLLVNRSTLVLSGGGKGYWTERAGIEKLTPDGQLQMDNANTDVVSDLRRPAALRRLTLDDDGNLRVYSLRPPWEVVWQAVQELCTVPAACGRGNNSICLPNGSFSTSCVCPPGFRNSSSAAGGTSSCALRRSFLPDSKFLRLDYVSFVADGNEFAEHSPLNFDGCRSACVKNATCVGFSYDFTGGRTCYNHFGALVDGYWSPANAMAMFVRVSASETDASNFTGMTAAVETVCPVRVALPVPPKEGSATLRNAAAVAGLFAAELLVGVLSFWAFLRKYSKYRDMARTFGLELLPGGGGPKRFSYAELKAATADFSNVVGRGGYFPRWAFEKVYVEKNVGEILDPRIMESYDETEHSATVERMVKTAMWCLQDRAETRPSMGKVAKMLEGSVEITEPSKPAIFCDPDE
ncbi:putative receptor protein kinase ZmPK1 [Ananas comosus]|uniref:non-specific serine/threonine protein kinase n=1 Tax=Ananas comosus TaxID=4615 RepID=A0A199VZ99_ANACO|nr:putative receptor protein kinase ZmPK1 [Ananas comosus]